MAMACGVEPLRSASSVGDDLVDLGAPQHLPLVGGQRLERDAQDGDLVEAVVRVVVR